MHSEVYNTSLYTSCHCCNVMYASTCSANRIVSISHSTAHIIGYVSTHQLYIISYVPAKVNDTIKQCICNIKAGVDYWWGCVNYNYHARIHKLASVYINT